jgi:hypothetical protein
MELMKLNADFENVILETLENELSTYDFFSSDIEPINHEACDGFYPYTNGGFRLLAITDLKVLIGSGSYPEELQSELDRIQENLHSDFADDHPQKVGKDNQPLEKYIEDFYKYEDVYLTEGCEVGFEVRVIFYRADNHRNVSGKNEILILSGVNTDYGYLRDSGLNVYFEKNLVVSDIDGDILRDTLIDSINTIF